MQHKTHPGDVRGFPQPRKKIDGTRKKQQKRRTAKHCELLGSSASSHTKSNKTAVEFTEEDPLRKQRGRNIPNKADHCLRLSVPEYF